MHITYIVRTTVGCGWWFWWALTVAPAKSGGEWRPVNERGVPDDIFPLDGSPHSGIGTTGGVVAKHQVMIFGDMEWMLIN